MSDAITLAFEQPNFPQTDKLPVAQRFAIFCRSPLCSIRRTGAGGCRCEDASKILGKMEKTQHKCDVMQALQKQALQNIMTFYEIE